MSVEYDKQHYAFYLSNIAQNDLKFSLSFDNW